MIFYLLTGKQVDSDDSSLEWVDDRTRPGQQFCVLQYPIAPENQDVGMYQIVRRRKPIEGEAPDPADQQVKEWIARKQ